MTRPITIHVKDDDEDVREWLENRRAELLRNFGLRVSLSLVAMGELRKAMENENGRRKKMGNR